MSLLDFPVPASITGARRVSFTTIEDFEDDSVQMDTKSLTYAILDVMSKNPTTEYCSKDFLAIGATTSQASKVLGMQHRRGRLDLIGKRRPDDGSRVTFFYRWLGDKSNAAAIMSVMMANSGRRYCSSDFEHVGIARNAASEALGRLAKRGSIKAVGKWQNPAGGKPTIFYQIA